LIKLERKKNRKILKIAKKGENIPVNWPPQTPLLARYNVFDEICTFA